MREIKKFKKRIIIYILRTGISISNKRAKTTKKINYEIEERMNYLSKIGVFCFLSYVGGKNEKVEEKINQNFNSYK